jgi:phage-related protein
MIREIITYGSYYDDFMASVTADVRKKIHYALDLLSSQERVSKKFVKHIRDGIYELRAEYESNIYRVFFIFDDGRIVVLFNGFVKKTQETPESEIQKSMNIRAEYYEYKQQQNQKY